MNTSTSNPDAIFMSSMANMFKGSCIATWSLPSWKPKGIRVYLLHKFCGIILMTLLSKFTVFKSTSFIPVCSLIASIISFSVMILLSNNISPSFLPNIFWEINASFNCSYVIFPELTKISPKRFLFNVSIYFSPIIIKNTIFSSMIYNN